MTNLSAPAVWIIGLLAVAIMVPVNCEDKVKRQLSEEPPVTYSSIPKTSFSCNLRGPGYYADMETGCQTFHVCQADRMDSFICPRGTSFNQKVFVCDWRQNVDCDSSPDFYSLNSRIGTDQPFRTSVFINIGSGRIGGSTAVTVGSSSEGIGQVGSALDGQIGSPSQARLKTVKPDNPLTKNGGKVRITSKIRGGNTLLPNNFYVEVPSAVVKEPEASERPTTEANEAPVEVTTKSPDASGSLQNSLSRGGGGATQRKTQTHSSRPRVQGYLPTSSQTRGKTERKDGYLPLDGSEESTSSPERGYLPLGGSGGSPSASRKSGPSSQKSSQRGSYLPTEKFVAGSPPNRGSYLPEATPEVSSSRESYLPEGSPDRSDSSNYLSEEPPRSAITDASFLLPPPSAPELPNSILGAFLLPVVDEYSPIPPTTTLPPLPPMNLLPLFNESTPPTRDSQLPPTTESYGVLEEEEASTVTAPASAVTTESPVASARGPQSSGRAPGRRTKGGDRGKNAGLKESIKKPTTEATPTSATTEFLYDFDRVRNALQERLRNVEPFDVPAETMATSDGTAVAPPSGGTRSDGVAPSPWLYSLAKVPM